MASYWVYLSSEVSANRVVIVLSRIVICDDAQPLALVPLLDVGHRDGSPVRGGAAVSGQRAGPVAGPAIISLLTMCSPLSLMVPGPPGHLRLLAVIRTLGAGGDGAIVATGRCQVSFVTQFKFKCFHFLW